MKGFWKGRRGKWLWVLCAVLAVWGCVGLVKMPEICQYAALAPEDMETAVKTWETREKVTEDTLYTIWRQCPVETEGGAQTAYLVCAGDGYFDVRPGYLKDGRLMSQEEMEKGRRVAVLDERLAFALFPTSQAVGSRVKIQEKWYDVIGVIRYAGGPGDTSEYGIILPLRTGMADGLTMEYAVAESRKAMGAGRALEASGQTALGEGTYADLGKEVTRAWMLPRVLIIVFGLYGAMWCLKQLIRRTGETIAAWKRRIREVYARAMLPRAVGEGALLALGFVGVIGAMAALLSLIIGPMYVFTEWVPDVIVEWSSVSGRAKELVAAAARTVRVQTPEMFEVRLYGGMVRWSVLCGLCAWVLWLLSKRRDEGRRGRR